MFSGIIESTQTILSLQNLDQAVRLKMPRPVDFSDLKLGDSIAINGVCLTLEEFDEKTMTFTLGAETLKVIRWSESPWTQRPCNLERSLKFGDRIHGHLVSGHVENLGVVTKSEALGESWLLDVKIQLPSPGLIWKKGSITLHGVSLTVNEWTQQTVSVCLIPETIKRTNLTSFRVGDQIHVEFDWMAKSMSQALQAQLSELLNDQLNELNLKELLNKK